ncbi:MAG: RnfABCDGE type electron transport complex subunit D [Clostridia bacterium]|nr:RnfABCDGE type electron transport complex subunit D [Clostridia bacterium]
MQEQKFVVSSSPHIHSEESVSSIMFDVLTALIPASVAGIYFFGYRAAIVLLTAVVSCVAFEAIYQYFMKKRITVNDLSAAVTGLLIGLNMPPSIPLWMVVIGSAFAIVIVKQLYGGLGKNFINPALAARCFMLIAWASAMTTYVTPFMGYGIDAVSSATPLAVLKGVSEGALPSLRNCFFGIKPGSIGETSAVMLSIGFIYLLVRKVIDFKIPAAYIIVFSVLTFMFGKTPYDATYTLYHILTGGLLLGAFFMATDYTTTPTTPLGQIIFGAGCGILTFVIRQFGGYPEGVSFSILLMNVVTPLIDRYTVPKKFGEVAKNVR